MIKAGFAEVDITPPPGTSISTFTEDAAFNALTPLSVTACVLDNGKKKVAIAGIDTAVITREAFSAAFESLKKEIGLDLLLCCASHTHKGGPAIRAYGGSEETFARIEEISPEIRKLGLDANRMICPPEKRGDRKLNEAYYYSLSKRISEAVAAANGKMEEVRLLNGRSVARDVGYNRRQRMKNGCTVTHAGAGNPDIEGFAGPCDDEVIVSAAVNRDGKVLGSIVNYGCHGTVEFSNSFSADWPYFMRETVRKMTGKDTVTVFINGCCGDVTQINNLDDKGPLRASGKWPKILGQRVGFAAIDAMTNGDAEEYGRIEFMTEKLILGYRKPGRKNYEKSVKLANTPPDDSYERFWALGTLLIKKESELNPDIECELNVLQVGNLLICTAPTEVFASTGLAIKASSHFPFTMVAELTNGWLGYLPTEDVFGPSGGGYEGQFKFGSYLEKTAENKVREKLSGMAGSFSPEKEKPIVKKEEGKPWWPATPEEL